MRTLQRIPARPRYGQTRGEPGLPAGSSQGHSGGGARPARTATPAASSCRHRAAAARGGAAFPPPLPPRLPGRGIPPPPAAMAAPLPANTWGRAEGAGGMALPPTPAGSGTSPRPAPPRPEGLRAAPLSSRRCRSPWRRPFSLGSRYRSCREPGARLTHQGAPGRPPRRSPARSGARGRPLRAPPADILKSRAVTPRPRPDPGRGCVWRKRVTQRPGWAEEEPLRVRVEGRPRAAVRARAPWGERVAPRAGVSHSGGVLQCCRVCWRSLWSQPPRSSFWNWFRVGKRFLF